MITQAPRGTADWYGDAMAKRERIEEICKRIAASYNIRQIATPVFFYFILFQKAIVNTTDIMHK